MLPLGTSRAYRLTIGHQDGIKDCLQARHKEKVNYNPDSLTFFAFSYYLSMKAPSIKYDWSSGRAQDIK